MDEKKIQLLLRNFARKRDWQKFHTPKNLATSISIEAAELLEIFQWSDDKLNIEKDKRIKQKISEEIADILLYTFRFCDLINLDAEKIWLGKGARLFESQPVILGDSLEVLLNDLFSMLGRLGRRLQKAKTVDTFLTKLL